MRNVTGVQGAKLITFQSQQRHSVTIVTHELHLECLTRAVDKNHGPHVPSHQTLRRQVAGERYDIEFIDRFHDFGRG